MVHFPLTIGCLKAIMTTATPYDGMPILQLLAFKRIVGDNGVRYRLLLSDGQFLHSFCVLATYLNHLIAEETLTVNSIFKVLSHVTTTVHRNGYDDASNSRRILVILDLEILKRGSEGRIVQPADVNATVKDSHSPSEPNMPIDSEMSIDQNLRDDSIHFREFEELDLFQPSLEMP